MKKKGPMSSMNEQLETDCLFSATTLVDSISWREKGIWVDAADTGGVLCSAGSYIVAASFRRFVRVSEEEKSE